MYCDKCNKQIAEQKEITEKIGDKEYTHTIWIGTVYKIDFQFDPYRPSSLPFLGWYAFYTCEQCGDEMLNMLGGKRE